MKQTLVAAVLALFVGGACSDGGLSAGAVAIEVSALALPSLSDVCWSFELLDSSGAAVWRATDICSSSFGQGDGGVSYVAPCDPDEGPLSLALTIDSVSVDGEPVDASEWVDPCAEGACVASVECSRSQTAPVEFEITIARAIDAGSFATAVSLGEITCDAAVACASADGQPLNQRFADGSVLPTAYLTVACATTRGVESTPYLYWDDLRVECPSDSRSVDLVSSSSVNEEGVIGGSVVSHAITAAADDELMVEASVALGIRRRDIEAGCRLAGVVTAHEGALGDFALPPSVTWPAIRFDVPLSADASVPVCGRHELWTEVPEVEVAFLAGGYAFTHEFDGAVVRAAGAAAVVP